MFSEPIRIRKGIKDDSPSTTMAVFQNSLPALKIYSIRHVYYKFLALPINFGAAYETYAVKFTSNLNVLLV